MAARELRLGVFVPQGWRMDLADIRDPVAKYETMSRCALEAERAGFDAVFLYDHFHTVPTPQLESVFECWTSTAALARDTTTVRLGQMVTCNGYRPPSLLAKMASGIDVMSRGRLILGIGAGWYEHEYRAYGYEYPETPDRLRMLRESLQIIKAMWTQDEATFEGRFYQVHGAMNEPKPVQKPHPPIWIGGAGEKVTLKLVAQYGDACNFNADVATVRRKLDVLREHCDSVGRDYDSITKTIEFYTMLGDRREIDRVVADTARRTGEDESYVRSWHPWHGDANHIAELIHEYADAGIEYVIVNLPNAFEGGVISRFAEEVFPRVGVQALSR
ncbi:MAG TPA: LLM class F420-dependent oxidoreductase [Candidatus Limnocylindrales bacterium]|nr:LLM class F420-dependent oxidoreductase [Candidatus Limnocylindrales bacterium]